MPQCCVPCHSPFEDTNANRIGPIIQEYHRYKCFVCLGHKDISSTKEEDHTITAWSPYGYLRYDLKQCWAKFKIQNTLNVTYVSDYKGRMSLFVFCETTVI